MSKKPGTQHDELKKGASAKKAAEKYAKRRANECGVGWSDCVRRAYIKDFMYAVRWEKARRRREGY